ncbi:hypothetical protein OG625_01500 [Streptomyces sp. NBC_01351]|uniref:hypothetical protein n=1 Tax=Streptomyces sp. NBC_01351 TaxID=2903833 RepID=UPI002E376EFC|nr:hypothetical protein [Streptomyces sp. NBC_01351]
MSTGTSSSTSASTSRGTGRPRSASTRNGTPAFGDRLLDLAIGAAAVRAADPDGLRFTERQLYYETCRVLSPAAPLLRRVPGSPPPTLRLPSFTRALDARGRQTVPGLLPATRPTTAGGLGQHRPAEPDLYDYGLPRLLLCQDHSIAAMLLANHVHLEAACPVLALPDALPLDPRLLAALERADGATVHVLHDASPEGVTLPARVRAALGPVPGVRVGSLGLVPRHAATLRLPSGRGPGLTPAAGADWPAALRPREAAWLARGRFAEVAAVPPARLVRTVLRLTRGPRPTRDSMWGELSGLRTAGFMTWPTA